MKIATRRTLLAALALGTALALPTGADAQRKFTFGYDQPKSTAYGIAGDIFEAKLKELSATPVGSTPEALAALVKSDLEKTGALIKSIGGLKRE